jgi:release factor glutamine methyltransferase
MDDFMHLLSPTSAIGELIRQIDRLFSSVEIEDSRLEAELLLAHVLGSDRSSLFGRLRESLEPHIRGDLVPLIKRRLKREPLAYIVGWRWFYGLRLTVVPGVLIPRQETEIIVDEALRLAHERFRSVPTIADIGCGSGSIAVSLAVGLPYAHIYAVDSSSIAVDITRVNCEEQGVSQQVNVIKGDLLESLPEPVDLIVANLPYVRSEDYPTLQPEVLYEPREALDGGVGGLMHILRMLSQLPKNINPGGAIVIECSPDQIGKLKTCFEEQYPHASIMVIQDLSYQDRVIEVLL